MDLAESKEYGEKGEFSHGIISFLAAVEDFLLFLQSKRGIRRPLIFGSQKKDGLVRS